ncbi:HD-GYP domain-containing protein [Natroniella sulfidigena]|uniref:HD-GYP domain-containing protein n=1 Tax=Natroniella sulfidigena TaxID=723921 RepID=UPI00200B91BD|nr:HD-GYP domain-containing protein [Natroniella sulfidigena]MCK8818079.1 HD-GYP domain-containing protein [Natroniella sulfidigena]
MRKVRIEKLTENMVLAKPIMYNGQVLLREGCQRIDKYKERLEEYGIMQVYIEDKISKGIEENKVISEQLQDECKEDVKEVIENITQNKAVDMAKLKTGIGNIVDRVLTNNNTLVNLFSLKVFDEYIFQHSVNVAVISIMIGKKLNYKKKRLIKLGLGAILHDVGKLAIPAEILKKPSSLTAKEYKIIKTHPEEGYKQFEGRFDISPVARIPILQHHERVDGSGYPEELKGEDIHEFGRVVAIADVFDALTSDRCYRQAWSVKKTVDFIKEQASKEFDDQIVDKLLSFISIYPNGEIVKLDDGSQAIVVEQTEDAYRPKVRIFKDKDGNKLNNFKEIDLSLENNIEIV